ncbi:MAG: 6-pyruvoyl trahydropterin synthase family protein [Planctomycetota bacterium]|jgi:6-pyruvoyltetrahydropterin/6-carboxytetrahydropterin synthase
MFTVLLETTFKAEHQLAFANGAREPLHEHEWKVNVAVSGEKLDDNDLLIDFEELKMLVEATLLDFRGKRLEAVGHFEHRNTSAENVARILYEEIAPKLPDTVRLDYVEITEAPGCRARYSA